MKVGIIGGLGWIGRSLGRALIETGRIAAGDLVILTRAGQPGEFYGHKVAWANSVADLVAQADVIVVSVRPQDWPALDLQAQGKLVISVMAGVPLRALPSRTIRALPNAAAELRQSYTPWFAGPGVTAEDRATATQILTAIGTCDALDSEHQIDLMTATAGAGPAYSALLARAIIGFLQAEGVRPEVAQRSAEAMICGAAPLMAGKMAEVEDLVQVFLDYKGTTAAGLTRAMELGFEQAVKAALAAATDKARAMSASA